MILNFPTCNISTASTAWILFYNPRSKLIFAILCILSSLTIFLLNTLLQYYPQAYKKMFAFLCLFFIHVPLVKLRDLWYPDAANTKLRQKYLIDHDHELVPQKICLLLEKEKVYYVLCLQEQHKVLVKLMG